MTTCIRCGGELVPDEGAPDDPVTYQFQNALWIAFHGGYGMFVDNLEVRLPTNSDERWLRNSDRRDGYGMYDDFTITPEGRLIDNLDWRPTYTEDRVLPGQPDYEAVLCHDCAHGLCEREPWLAKLINPHGSHTHKTEWKDAHPDHFGWDYDMDKERTT
jgi:hypothetical protein